TVVEPWLGFYFDKGMSNSDRTNYALRETMRKEKAKNPGGATAFSTCGANPGMVSWFVEFEAGVVGEVDERLLDEP
ncbi:hypothetical protein ACC699_40695, partial [Rhizobium ruizarguesonis]